MQAWNEPVAEDAPLRLETSELMLRHAAAACDFRYVALRYFNLAGASTCARSPIDQGRNASYQGCLQAAAYFAPAVR
jgi:UDP-glucose 4-epimerase